MDANFHIGDEIRKELEERQRSVAWLAHKIGKESGNLCRQLKAQHIKTDLLCDISAVLEVDFLKFYE
jgi:hypothetical protein